MFVISFSKSLSTSSKKLKLRGLKSKARALGEEKNVREEKERKAPIFCFT